MKNSYKILVSLLLVLFTTTSCVFQGLTGNGNIQSEDRNISQEFNAISASQGIDVYLTTNEQNAIRVEADENIIDLIKTEVVNDELKIYLDKQVWHSKARKVYVSVPSINQISTSSGATVKAENSVKCDKLELHASSGSDIFVNVVVTDLSCSTSSGADISITGIAKNFKVKSSSGSDVRAGDLDAEYVNAHASSGADIKVNVSRSIQIRSNSGGDVSYTGNPAEVNKRN